MVVGVGALQDKQTYEPGVFRTRGWPNEPIAVMEPWQNIGAAGGLAVFGLIMVAYSLGMFDKRKSK